MPPISNLAYWQKSEHRDGGIVKFQSMKPLFVDQRRDPGQTLRFDFFNVVFRFRFNVLFFLF